MEPLVTIGICTYRRTAYLRHAIASAQNQTYKNLEIRIHQNPCGGKEDAEIEAIVGEFSVNDPRVIFFRNPRNRGMGGNWNSVIEEARGKYLSYVSDDDLIKPDLIARAVPVLEQDPRVALFFANHDIVDSDGKLDPAQTEAYNRNHRGGIAPGLVPDARAVAFANSVPIAAITFRTEAIRPIGFQVGLDIPEYDAFVRLALAGGLFYFDADNLGTFRMHPENLHKKEINHDFLAERLLEALAHYKATAVRTPFLKHTFRRAVELSLVNGDKAKARRFYTTDEYGADQRASKQGVQHRLMLMMPTFANRAFYRFKQRLRK